MRILLIGNFLSATTGVKTVSEELAEHLAELGWTVEVASTKLGRLARLKDILFTILARRTEYDVVHVEVYSGLAFSLAEVACLALHGLRKPYVLTLHGGNLPAFAQRWPGRVRRMLQGAAAVTAPSRYLKDQMWLYRNDILLIPNPLNLKQYQFRLRSVSRPHLVWLRAFHKIYNPQLAPTVITDLCASFPEVTLTMIGPDKGDGALQETQTAIEQLGLQDHIRILPGIPKHEVPGYLEQADIFLNTTNVDNTPVSVLEAMACGLCIVSTNAGGNRYLLEDEQDALLVSPNNSKGMGAAVERVLTDPGLAARLSGNARKKAEQFDWALILERWQTLFEAVLQHGRSMA